MPANPSELTDISEIPAGEGLATIDPEAAASLDELFKETTEGESGDDTPPATTTTTPVVVPPVVDPPVVDPPETDPAKKFVDDPATAAPATPALVETPAVVPPVKDELDAVPIPQYIKPKTGEAFAEVKRLAREKISVLQKERDELKAKTDELAKAAAPGLPKEVEEELNNLRQFRNKMDVQADPEFKHFDVTVTENVDSIYEKLKVAGFTEESLKKIRDLGGPKEVDWEALSEKIPAGLKRFIDSKLVENESLTDKKSRAVKTAQENAEEYLKGKANESVAQAKARVEESNRALQGFLPKVPWLAEQVAKADSTPEQKADIERHNKLVKEVNGGIAMIIEDESPSMRAIMAINYAQHLKLKTDHSILKATSDSQIKDLTDKLAKANDLLERVKTNSTNRLRNTPATVEGNPNGASIDRLLTEDPGSALDSIAKDVLGGGSR